ncbi:MAG: class I tRNA ligase family protein, partial [candidate division WOR-3 bacterium]
MEDKKFLSVPQIPDFVKIEHKILKFWQENNFLKQLMEKNKGKKKFSFLDGPITANNPMGVHHAWGRTYKDVIQRYKAQKGFDQRFQNGFDCQGLWVEVEVEKELGFKSKKDIEKFGIDKFVEKCKERVLKYSQIQTQQSIRLGQ